MFLLDVFVVIFLLLNFARIPKRLGTWLPINLYKNRLHLCSLSSARMPFGIFSWNMNPPNTHHSGIQVQSKHSSSSISIHLAGGGGGGKSGEFLFLLLLQTDCSLYAI